MYNVQPSAGGGVHAPTAQAPAKSDAPAAKAAPTPTEIFQGLYHAFRKLGGRHLTTFRDLDKRPQTYLDSLPVGDHTVFSFMQDHIEQSFGLPMGGNVGDVQRALGWTPDQVHDFACYCDHGDRMTGDQAAVAMIQAMEGHHAHMSDT